MRRPAVDDRWDRACNLIIPRRPTLPTRRYLQKMGAAPDCCSQGGPAICCDGLYNTWIVDIPSDGWTDVACDFCDQVQASAPWAVDYYTFLLGNYHWTLVVEDVCPEAPYGPTTTEFSITIQMPCYDTVVVAIRLALIYSLGSIYVEAIYTGDYVGCPQANMDENGKLWLPKTTETRHRPSGIPWYPYPCDLGMPDQISLEAGS